MLDQPSGGSEDQSMHTPARVDDDLAALIAFAAGVPRDDGILFERLSAYVGNDPQRAFGVGEILSASDQADRREIGADIVGMAAEIDRSLRDRAIHSLRRTMSSDHEPGPISAAIVKLGLLNDHAAHDAMLRHARHQDDIVRHASPDHCPRLAWTNLRSRFSAIYAEIPTMTCGTGRPSGWARSVTTIVQPPVRHSSIDSTIHTRALGSRRSSDSRAGGMNAFVHT
jgi:hypothetical protein